MSMVLSMVLLMDLLMDLLIDETPFVRLRLISD